MYHPVTNSFGTMATTRKELGTTVLLVFVEYAIAL
jgi:hypothetical protein